MVPMVPLLLVTILLCPFSPEAQEYYVTPTPPPNPDCPLDQPCHTLSYYASNASSLFNNRENVSLLFLDGFHVTQLLLLYQVQSLTIASVNKMLAYGNVSIQFNLQVNDTSVLTVKNVKLQHSNLTIGNVEWLINQNTVYEDSEVSILSTTTKEICSTDSIFMRSDFSANIDGNHSTNVQIANTVSLDSDSGFQFKTSTDTNVTITNSRFENNEIGIIIRGIDEVTDKNVKLQLELIHSQFIKNQLACYIQHSGNHSVLFQNVSVINNVAGEISSFGSVTIRGPARVTMENCLFENNTGVTALLLLHINLFFTGPTKFLSNSGVSGGAMTMINTTMWLDNGTYISFINNTAIKVGGAIWIPQEVSLTFYTARTGYPPCFYQLTFDLVEPLDNRSLPVSIHFSGNRAPAGGDDIYGVALQSNCKMTPNQRIESYMVKEKIFRSSEEKLSSISSSPHRVCLCENNMPVCVNAINPYEYSYFNVSVTPGERFNLSVALVGNDFGLVTGGVYALDRSGEDVSLLFPPEDKLKLQLITDLRCTDIGYSVHPVSKTATTVELLLSTDIISVSEQRVLFQTPALVNEYETSVQLFLDENEITSLLLTSPVFIRITILPCPLGLSLTEGMYKKCQCQPGITTSCEVINNTGVFYRSGTSWIGTVLVNNTIILANEYCPFGYCKSETLGVNLDNPDIQCALNHSGVLCGGCLPGLSLAIGSSRCIDCPDNNGVALLVVFIVAGVALVLFIKLLDLTVAHGTINGLILYANIIWNSQGIFFPVREQADQLYSNFYYFLRVFVAWLNLDFGIETCFIQGLDAYGKTWLQFIFPIYLWLIALFIVLLCRYSTRATKIFGNNAVAVLTTLFFLSYTKLLRNNVLILGAAGLRQFNPVGYYAAWRLDSNIEYFGNPHAFLFLTAVAVSTFLYLPLILTLLFVGHLHRLPCTSIARRVIKSRPLLDTFTGPLKAKHQYWVGLTFLIRSVLVIIAILLEASHPTVNIDLVVLASALLCSVVFKVYKNIYLCLFDFAFLFNLVILGVAFLTTDDPESRVVFTCTSVSISFLIFVGILAYHLYLIIRKCYKPKEAENAIQKQPAKTVTTYDVDLSDFTTTMSYAELREDLLESNIIN